MGILSKDQVFCWVIFCNISKTLDNEARSSKDIKKCSVIRRLQKHLFVIIEYFLRNKMQTFDNLSRLVASLSALSALYVLMLCEDRAPQSSITGEPMGSELV